MIPWLVGMFVCLGLLVGCGGGHKGSLIFNEPVQTEVVASSEVETEETLAEELSAKRLEELYAKSGIPGWDPGLEEELKKWDHQVKFDVPIQMNKQVRAYLVYFSTERKEIIRRYLSRSTRYLPMIKETFQEYGLPEDLAYLAMIESGFNNKAYSHASACGMWQFIRGTGLRYGLAIDGYVDERRDPEKATRAAAKYLLDLYKRFGSWYLAAASYNCGEGRVQKELNQSNHKNFWQLSENQCLPNETKNYVPQMIAATIIAKNPEKFGFKNVPYQPPLALDRVQVNESTSLKATAVAVNVPLEEVQALNPELLRGVTPPDSRSHGLNLPPKSKENFAQNIVIARIEHPAVASRPTRTAKASGRYYQSRDTSQRQAATARKSDRKSKTATAKDSSKQATKATYAKKSKSSRNSSPQLAHMLGQPSAVAKNSNSKNSGKQVASGDSKRKTKASAQKNGKKQGSAQVAKKSENSSRSKTSHKNGSSPSRSKDKVSKKGSRPLVVSEAK
jgi:membrane-bound lytic murein transglycosylase D